MLFYLEFFKSIKTTLKAKINGHSKAELSALSWFYWFEEMHKKGVTADRVVTCLGGAREAQTALMREIGDATWFTPESDKTEVSEEPLTQQDPELPNGVSSLEEYRQMKDYKDNFWHQ